MFRGPTSVLATSISPEKVVKKAGLYDFQVQVFSFSRSICGASRRLWRCVRQAESGNGGATTRGNHGRESRGDPATGKPLVRPLFRADDRVSPGEWNSHQRLAGNDR